MWCIISFMMLPLKFQLLTSVVVSNGIFPVHCSTIASRELICNVTLLLVIIKLLILGFYSRIFLERTLKDIPAIPERTDEIQTKCCCTLYLIVSYCTVHAINHVSPDFVCPSHGSRRVPDRAFCSTPFGCASWFSYCSKSGIPPELDTTWHQYHRYHIIFFTLLSVIIVRRMVLCTWLPRGTNYHTVAIASLHFQIPTDLEEQLQLRWFRCLIFLLFHCDSWST